MDETTFNNFQILVEDEFAFVNEARLFLTYLSQMKKHPIKPSAKIFRIELNRDIKRFEDLLAREQMIDDEQIDNSSQAQKLLEAYAKCEERAIDSVFIIKIDR